MSIFFSFLIQNVLQRNTVKVLVDDTIQSLPYGKCRAIGAPLTFNRVVIQTCYRRKITFSEPQDLSHSISVRRFGKSVSALKAACGFEDIGSV